LFDFRYHAITIVAVFLALVIGLLLGVAIGDRGLVSGAEQQLREDLRANVEAARAESRELRGELGRRDRYEQETFPAVVADRLSGRRVAVITLHQGTSTMFDAVRDAVTPAGGQVSFVGRLRLPPDLNGLADATAGTRFGTLTEDVNLLTPLATRLGAQIVTGGRLLRSVRREVFASSSGELDGAEAIVVVRGEPPQGRPDDEVSREDAFVGGIVDGIESFQTPIVGIERSDAESSQVGWYQGREMASVDNVDQAAGRAALVLALAGGGVGAYGIKSSAEAMLPETLLAGG
jgi:hypothetical protein